MSSDLLNSFCGAVEAECYFAKVRFLDRMVASIFEKAFQGYNLNAHQFSLMVAIHSMGDAASAKLISHFLKMEKSTVSRDLKSLIGKGFISEKVSGADSRAKKLFLTKAGKSTLSASQKPWREAQEKAREAFARSSIVLTMKPARERVG